MIEFPCHKDCTDCGLCEDVKSPGIPTRVFEVSGHDRALLVVGMAPGWHEDEAGKSWVGWSGDILGKFIKAAGFPQLVDVYLSNALRCMVPAKQKPTKGQINACRSYLLMDIQRLLDNYKEVIILACGADAAKAVAGVSSLGEGFKLQGLVSGAQPLQILSRLPVLFFTYHPAILYPGRKPEKVGTIQNHFLLVKRYLTGNFIPNTLQVVPEVGVDVPTSFPKGKVSLDVETYGILKGREQTVFTPVKSRYIDGVPYGQQIITACFAYRDFSFKPSPGRIRTCVYLFNNPSHLKTVRKWIKGVIETKNILLGQNFKYDLLYLKMNDPFLDKLLSPNLVRVDDTLIKSFLLDEHQAEKGLKELCLLYGITSYRGLKVDGKQGNARSSNDPDLLYYNSLDSAATIVLDEEVDVRIKMRYGESSAKLGPVCAKMRNDVLWNVVEMERAGGRIDIPRLEEVNDDYTDKSDAAFVEALKMGVTVGGEGSRKSLLDFMTKSIEECGLRDDKRLELTETRREVSVNKANRNLLLQYLPEGDLRKTMDQLVAYKENSHLRDTYTNKLLTKQREGIVYRRFNVGLFYPVWYPVPSVFEKGSEKGKEKSGGTIQGRITCRKPPAQTFPDSVLDCLVSRFPAGTLRTYDLNRIELVVPAFFSGDLPLQKSLAEGNPHTDTALLIYPDADPTDPGWKSSDKYQLGKDLNFLVIYRGGPVAFQMLTKKFGAMLELEFCRNAIDVWYGKHPVLKAWQDRLIETVIRTGFLELPMGWSRTFGKGVANAKAVESEICNFPVQTTAALVLLSSQFVFLQGLTRNKLRARMCHQSYDAFTVDTPRGEEEAVDSLADKALVNPPLRGILEGIYGRELPLGYDRKVQ